MTWVLANWRILILGAIILLLGIQTWRLNNCQNDFEQFRITTEALGRAQKAKVEADKEANEKLTKEIVDAKDKAISDLSTRYAAARRVLNNARSGGVPTPTEAPSLASACEPSGGSAGGLDSHQKEISAKLAEVEAALLDAMERADREMVKYRELWRWANGVR